VWHGGDVSGWRRWVPVGVALVMAATIAALALSWPGDGGEAGEAGDEAGATTTVDPDVPAVVASVDTGDPADLAGLLALSDLVVVGTVEAVERGRAIDGADGAGVESALVTIQVESVVRGEDPGSIVVVEEEGWLADGRRIALDGAGPTEPGDRGLWFLADTGDPDSDAWVTVGRVGRWIERDGLLGGPQLDIPIAIDLQDRPLDDVVADIAVMPAPAGTS
jgi:hypothetical protein